MEHNNNNNNNSNNNKNLICDGEFEIVRITDDFREQAIELFKKYFLKYENISIAANLMGSQQTIDEMDALIRFGLNDGISFAAKKINSDELVAIAVNKILNPSTNCTFDELFSTFKTNEMGEVGNCLELMENTHNIFKEWNIDCILEILFLSTKPEYGGKGIAATLSQYSIDFGRSMLNGTLPSDLLQALPTHVRNEKPKAATAVFSTRFTQRIGEKLGFKMINKVPTTEVTFRNKPFAEYIDPIHKVITYEALRL